MQDVTKYRALGYRAKELSAFSLNKVPKVKKVSVRKYGEKVI